MKGLTLTFENYSKLLKSRKRLSHANDGLQSSEIEPTAYKHHFIENFLFDDLPAGYYL